MPARRSPTPAGRWPARPRSRIGRRGCWAVGWGKASVGVRVGEGSAVRGRFAGRPGCAGRDPGGRHIQGGGGGGGQADDQLVSREDERVLDQVVLRQEGPQVNAVGLGDADRVLARLDDVIDGAFRFWRGGLDPREDPGGAAVAPAGGAVTVGAGRWATWAGGALAAPP
jgi:hypothetical protein